MKIAVITAMHEEYQAVAASFAAAGIARSGKAGPARYSTAEHEFIIVAAGMGFDNAARAVEMLIREESPDLLISTGFCGGIAPELQVGDVVVAKRMIIADRESLEEVPVLYSSIGQSFVARQVAEGKRVVGGTFISSPAITSKKRLAGMLSAQYLNPVVEMESSAIAIVATENDIPLLAIRVVSDSAAEELGFSLDELCDSYLRRIRLYKVLLTVLRKPAIILQLLRLAFNSRRAAASLTSALSSLFPLFQNHPRR